jgi:hypothetical protein
MRPVENHIHQVNIQRQTQKPDLKGKLSMNQSLMGISMIFSLLLRCWEKGPLCKCDYVSISDHMAKNKQEAL